ncbi:MAG: MATE family efflux transporter [Pyrinomonadaceae bacterium]|jgi:putative MATE family efflux protein|nr:MATE family efflux transporter [Pyrinomonadaceae bacterium]
MSSEISAETEEKPSKSKYDRSIIEGPLGKAIWKLAAPTMVANFFGGLQGLVDHIIVGNIVGFKGNAAIGVSWQIFLVVVVFVASIFTGMSILVARFVGAGEVDKVNRTVYQAFITALFIALAVIAPIGYFASPLLLNLVNADAGVQIEALPYLRTMFLFSSGMMIFFMLSAALRSAGDGKTPMTLGLALTVLNVIFNIIFISGLGPIPSFGVQGSAIGTCIASGLVAIYSFWKLWNGSWVISLKNKNGYAPDFDVIRKLFKFGLPAGFQGIAMNIGGVLMLSFIGSLAQSAAAQAAYAVTYTQLFSLITWTSVALMGATSAVVGQNLGAKQIERANSAAHISAKFGFIGSAIIGFFYFFFPYQLLGIFGMKDENAVEIGVQLLRFLSISGIFVSVALAYTGGLQGTGDTKSPLFISIISQLILPLAICFVIQQTVGLEAWHIWLAIVLGHFTRCILSLLRFSQGKWRGIKVEIETTAG